MGISDGRFFSGVAALTTNEGLLIVPPGEDKAFIAPKSIDLLPATTETQSAGRLTEHQRQGYQASC